MINRQVMTIRGIAYWGRFHAMSRPEQFRTRSRGHNAEYIDCLGLRLALRRRRDPPTKGAAACCAE